jgi:hypothetical protein
LFNQNDINILIQNIPNGRQNAITARVIAQRLGYPVGGNQVKIRKLIDFAIDNSNVILSSSGRVPKGYWFSIDRQETIEYIASLRNRASEITDRADNLRAGWNNVNPNNRI